MTPRTSVSHRLYCKRCIYVTSHAFTEVGASVISAQKLVWRTALTTYVARSAGQAGLQAGSKQRAACHYTAGPLSVRATPNFMVRNTAAWTQNVIMWLVVPRQATEPHAWPQMPRLVPRWGLYAKHTVAVQTPFVRLWAFLHTSLEK